MMDGWSVDIQAREWDAALRWQDWADFVLRVALWIVFITTPGLVLYLILTVFW